MTQGDLFGLPKNYKRDEASRAAARAAEPTRKTHCAKVLELLREGPQTGRDLVHVSWRAAARVKDLRDLGHKIETTVGPEGVATYRLEE